MLSLCAKRHQSGADTDHVKVKSREVKSRENYHQNRENRKNRNFHFFT